jgi:ribose transport system permease protein
MTADSAEIGTGDVQEQLPSERVNSFRMALAAAGRYRGLPALAGAVCLWLAIGFVGKGSFGGTLASATSVAAFLTIAGLGQMFVIASGNGNIDLSVPYVLTFAAYLGSSTINGSNAKLAQTVIVVAAFGIMAGLVNATVISALRVPPIVATLAVGFIVESGYQELSTHVNGGLGSALDTLSTGGWAGVSYMAIIALACIVLAQVALSRSWFARGVLALGQSRQAARLVGVRTLRLTFIVYAISGLAAAVVGLLLGAYIGGGSLDMGGSYQLDSVAVVVLGGCLVSGGIANAPGVGIASVFITLLVTLTNLLHVSAGVEQIIEGLIIVGLLAVVGKEQFSAD